MEFQSVKNSIDHNGTSFVSNVIQFIGVLSFLPFEPSPLSRQKTFWFAEKIMFMNKHRISLII